MDNKEINQEVKDEVKTESTVDVKESNKSRTTTGLLICIIILLIALLGTILFFTLNKDKLDNKIVQENTVKELSINSVLIKKLYSYVNTKYFMPDGTFSISNSDGKVKKTSYPVLFYRENTTISNLENDLKILSVCSALYDEKLYTTRKVLDNEELADENIYIFSIESIQNKAKEMFNTTINIEKNGYSWNGEELNYNNETNSYEYSSYISGGGTNLGDDFKIIKAEQKDDEIYIYDNYVREKSTDSTTQNKTYIYASSDEKIKIKEFNDHMYLDFNIFDYLSNLGIKLPIYKHTFKRSENGTYYWEKTELTNKNELNIIN